MNLYFGIFFIIFVTIFLFATIQSENCLRGSVYVRGISEQGKKDVVNAHNSFRLDIAYGRVPNQPKGTNLLRMEFDETLSQKARVVSNTCQMKHISIFDGRWNWVGQNLYISWSSRKDDNQDWNTVVSSWFNEHENFIYPNTKKTNKVVGHYTQVVWHNSKFIGCDFISFYDKNQPSYPYAKLYTCNYGPGGNWKGQAPYETGSTGCENLC